jgi:hypothetical protein
MSSPLRTRSAGPLALVAACLLIAASPAARAGLNTYYQEDFTGQAGEGIITNTTYSNASWSVNGTSAPSNMGHAQVTAAPNERFEFSEVAGPGNGGASASVIFETAAVAISVSNPAYLAYLTMTLDATLAGTAVADGDGLSIQSLVNNVVVASTSLTLNTAGQQVVHDLAPYILAADTPYSYGLRVTASQLQVSGTSSFTLDNVLVEGLSVPEPASMSLLGMGIAAIGAAGYRRRQKSATAISG